MEAKHQLQVTSVSVLTTDGTVCACVCVEHCVPWQSSGQEMSFLPVVAIITCHLKIHPLHHCLCLSVQKHICCSSATAIMCESVIRYVSSLRSMQKMLKGISCPQICYSGIVLTERVLFICVVQMLCAQDLDSY